MMYTRSVSIYSFVHLDNFSSLPIGRRISAVRCCARFAMRKEKERQKFPFVPSMRNSFAD